MADWKRRFDDPVPMPDGSTIRTIGEAAEYATKLPKKISEAEPWLHAVCDLLMASEHPAFVFLARIAFYRAVHGDEPVKAGKVRPTKAERFKAKRAAVKKR